MERDYELFNALYLLRQQIREREKAKTGRTPTVCPDDALREMIRLMPKKASDFYSISGVGPAFVENFAPEFLAVINGNKAADSATVSGNVEETLRELSKKLININKTNRMLFLPKLASKYAVDLYDANGRYNPLDILFSATEPMVISEAADQDLSRTNPARERYKNLVNLIRESSRDMRDKGQNDLYIGYPFVQGCLSNGEFGIRAPLCLFPVVLDRSTTSISISLDPTRDIIYNSTLVLAHFKFNSITSPMPDCVPEEVNPDTFLQALLDFYASNDIRIEYTSDELKKFTEYPGETFPRYTRGTLKLVHNIVVGKFPAYSNAIQRDFEQIMNKGLVNRLVSDLISDYGAIDFYSDHDDSNPELTKTSIPENSLVYINALNSAQETVLHALNTTDELVVEGPPGTGKSQTITSLITQFVDQGKNVLMVSEKKTALDVVYSRLGTLSRYAVMMDDANNKNLFYSQLERLLLSTDANAPIEAPDLSPISAEIDTDVATLEIIADKLFKPGEFGVAPYKLYMENRRINLQNHEQIKTYKTIRTVITDELLHLNYDEIAAIHKKFANGQLTNSLDHYQLTIERYPWFLKMKDDLSNYDLILFTDAIDEMILKIDEWRNLPFMKRQTAKGRLTKDIQNLTKDYFQKAALILSV